MFIPRPTRGGLLFLTATLAALGVALMNVGLITALLAASMLALSLTGFLLAFFAAHGYEVRRETAADGVCPGKISLPLTVTNRFPWYRQSCVVTEKLPFCEGGRQGWETPPLAPHESVVLKRELSARKRGHFRLLKLQLASGDPCGLFQVRKTFRLPGEIRIAPRVVPLENPPTADSGGDAANREGRTLGHSGLGANYFGVRPYRPGDEMRFVHWRLSAAKKKLMVREFEASATDRTVLILDTCAASIGQDEAENNFEALISLAASITEHLAARCGYLTFITRFGRNDIMRIGGDAAGVRFKIQEALIELKPTRGKFSELVSEVLESLPDGSVLYLLGMSATSELAGLARLVEDRNIRLEWVNAAPEYFPAVLPDEPMEICLPLREKRFPKVFGPRLLTFQTPLEGLFRDEEFSE